jgi:SagB-type dehydrogenase family enzyme
MSPQFVLSFKPDISFIEQPESQQVLLQSSPAYRLKFQPIQPGLNMALKALSCGGATLDQLNQWVKEDEGAYPVIKFYIYLQKFSQLGWLCHSVLANGKVIATAVAIAPHTQLPSVEVTKETQYTLSRFAYLHQVEGKMLLESPLSKMQIYLPDWRSVALISQLSQPCTYLELTEQVPGICSQTAKELIGLLLSAQMLTPYPDGMEEEGSIALRQWEFHDLLFHTRSRQGRHGNLLGGTYRFLGKIEPLPAIKPPMSTEGIALFKPDIETLKTTDISFTQVLETRRSIREYGENPLTLPQLGEFLYRCARVRQTMPTEHGELCDRPFPSGGGLYELELYPVIKLCVNITSGLYHYHPQEHKLYRISASNSVTETLLQNAALSMAKQDKPQVLIMITARFQRLAWKYESIAYTLMLKHVGVLYQTMYLVATAMNLAPCAIGCGDSDLFTKATGIDYYTETSIGEFILGSRQE